MGATVARADLAFRGRCRRARLRSARAEVRPSEKAGACTPPPASSSASRAAKGRASPRSRGRWPRTLEQRGYPALLTFEPGDTPVGKEMRRIVLDPATGELSDRTEVLLYAADKAEHVDTVVLPALERREVVITDRYVDSTLAYQGAGRTLDAGEVEHVARWATRDLRPHLTVVLDLDPEHGFDRFAERDRIEGESPEFHRRVRAAFLAMAAADPAHYLVLDARRPSDEIAAAVWEPGRAPARTGGAAMTTVTAAHGLGLPGRPAPRDRGAPHGRVRPRHEPGVPVHRAARLRALQRRGRVRRRPAVRGGAARLRGLPLLPHRAGRQPRRRHRRTHGEAVASGSTRSATSYAARRSLRSGGGGRS